MARSHRRTQAPPPQRLILDSGAVIALSRNDVCARAVLAAAWEAADEECYSFAHMELPTTRRRPRRCSPAREPGPHRGRHWRRLDGPAL
jgi:hypothetical protein